jgi:cytochrome c556
MKRQTMLAEIDRQLTQCQIDLAGIHALGAIDDDADALLEKLKTLHLIMELTENEKDYGLSSVIQEINTLIDALKRAGIGDDDIDVIKERALTAVSKVLENVNIFFRKLKTYHTNAKNINASVQASVARLRTEIDTMRAQLKSQGLTDDQIRLLEQIAEESTR